jgi:pimeloyl-ACP methyl ester carboxylesterase/DNA-binding CsgD family transcriptional regulator
VTDEAPIVRYTHVDGMPVAWTSVGHGPPIVMCATTYCFSHAYRSRVLWGGVAALSKRNRVIVYDGRGTGLSDRRCDTPGLETGAADLEAVADAAGLRRFALLASVSGGQTAIRFAARHPDRVERLVLLGTRARGTLRSDPAPAALARFEATLAAIEAGWDGEHSAFRLMFVAQLWPDATREEYRELDAYHRALASGRTFAALLRANAEADVSDEARAIRCPTLVAHSRGDPLVPFAEAVRVAALIPGAELLPIDSAHNVPLAGDSERTRLSRAIDAFVRRGRQPADGDVDGLTPRERTILELLARGLDNLQIAAHLGLSEKTVRNNIGPIYDKLGVENRGQAIVRARASGLGDAAAH